MPFARLTLEFPREKKGNKTSLFGEQSHIFLTILKKNKNTIFRSRATIEYIGYLIYNNKMNQQVAYIQLYLLKICEKIKLKFQCERNLPLLSFRFCYSIIYQI